MPLGLAWAHYEVLLQQQEEVLSSGVDADALRYGLKRFPALERVTITPAAHGRLNEPLYETPMIRSLPYEFNYPMPQGWPIHSYGDQCELPPWNLTIDLAMQTWRGFRCVVSELVGSKLKQPQHQVSELVVDTHTLPTGLNCRIFDTPPCLRYYHLAVLLEFPGFRRVDIL
ncbi:hypothetical protein BX600DRAFT_443884 [Xylariales sp. PMI_506]|nr:hypothetical protein BX600DRAFT_443884 [Xylariales sp. PMI_506]